MVWPERRLRVLAPLGAEGLAGFQGLLAILGLKHDIEQNGWQEQTEAGKDTDVHKKSQFGLFEEFITTDLIVWPEIPDSAQRQREAQARGITVMSPQEFLECCWQADHVLPVYPPFACAAGKPLLWSILREAGFAPSLLWYEDGPGWQGILGDGPYWVVPGDWLSQIAQNKALGRKTQRPDLAWVIRPESIDFYQTGLSLRFCGSLPRWSEALTEESVCSAVAQALELGIGWPDIRRALGLEQSTQGWLRNDTGGTQGPDRTELSLKQTDDLENRWAG